MAILKELRNGTDDAALVKTTIFLPTGFPSKWSGLKDTLSDDEIYEARRRVVRGDRYHPTSRRLAA